MDVGVDVGGTFTDFVGFRGRSVVSLKLPSTRDPAEAVNAGMREVGATGMSHGTTVATNAILERKGARIAFITTAGFEDLLTIARQNRPSLYDFRVTRPSPPVPRERCFGLRERVDARGRPLLRPTPREIQRVVRAVRDSGAESVAVSLLFSFLRPQHERAMARALGDLPISVSHEVLAEFREYERSSTTVLDAYVKPLVTRYIAALDASLRHGFLVMRSSGSVTTDRAVVRRPIDMVLSGPAGGVAAAASIARAPGLRHLMTFDMGGTSADFSVLEDGEPAWTTEAVIDTFPLALPVVDIESVGAGGGSLAVIDPGGALRVGPESAGADPGPVAYGKGGDRVTVTDADLVGGALGPGLLGGALPLRKELAAKAIERLAADLRISADEAVLGVQRVVRASMAKAMRLVLARRGVDPTEQALLAFGGAGPMHAVALAREIGMRTVVVPFLPGAFSAYGVLISPVGREYSRSVVRPLDRAGPAIARAIAEFKELARSDLESQGFDPRRALMDATVDLRFRGQSYELSVPLRGDLAASFRRAHRARFGYASRHEPIELVTVRLAVRVPRPVRTPARPPRPSHPSGHRRVLFEDGWLDAEVVHRDSLGIAAEVDGPVIIEEDHATTVVPPDARGSIRPPGLLVIEVGT